MRRKRRLASECEFVTRMGQIGSHHAERDGYFIRVPPSSISHRMLTSKTVIDAGLIFPRAMRPTVDSAIWNLGRRR